ncbi:MAG TPA: NAD(P)H-binding protein [Solirubrobacterales bacterium]|jgi:uncharacterized protein YbjT (DUF2867 family)
MQVAVVGGTGTLGAPLVAELVERGNDVRVLSRGSAGSMPAGASHRRIDLSTGSGLVEALDGIEVVVDAANAQKDASEVLVEGTRRLLEAEGGVGVRHHLAISVLGCDRVPTKYYRCKLAQEAALAAGEVPWSLLRATQFHPLLAGIFAAAARRRVRLTGKARLQPIDPVIVARRLADAIDAGPAGRIPDIAGPEARTLGELSRAWQRADRRRLLPLRIPSLGKLGRSLRDGGLCDPSAAAAGPSFEEWLRNA